LYPDRMRWWTDIENWKSEQIGKQAHFHDTRTYAQLGDFVQRQGDWIFDDEAYLCQADDGECTE